MLFGYSNFSAPTVFQVVPYEALCIPLCMSNKKYLRIDFAVGGGLAVIAAVVYFWTLCPSVFPGPSASAFVVSAGITPRLGPAYPLWFALCELLITIFPDASLIKLLNGVSAVCAAGAVWALYSVVRMTIWLSLKVEEENFSQHLFASRLAGGVAASALAFTCPFWIAANRCHWATFHILLLLFIFRIFLVSVQRGSNRLGYLFAFLYGVGCVEYPTFYVFTPLIAIAFFFTSYKDERLTVGLMSKTLACFLIGLLAYVPAAWIFAQSEGAQFREIPQFGDSLRVTLLDAWTALARSLPRQGWLIILVSTSLPWVVILSMGKRALNGQGDASVVVLHIVLSALVVAVLVNSPLSPWAIIGKQRILVMPYVLTAWTTGYLAAYFFLLPKPQWRNKEAEVSQLRRIMSGLLPAILIGFSASLPFINAKAADARPAKALAQIAETLLGQLSGQKWIISDGSLDAQFFPIIQRDHLPVKVLSLASLGYKPLRTFMLKQIDDVSLRSRAEIGIDTLLREWFGRPEEAVRDVVVMTPASAWSSAGLIPVPNVLFFSGAQSRSEIDPIALKKSHMAAWDDLIPVFDSTIEHEAFAPLVRHIRRQAGLIANNLGVLLEDFDMKGDAYEVYRMARRLDPNNVSALLNAHGIVLGGGELNESDIVKKEMEDMLLDFEKRPVQIVDLMRYYGDVRESRALASMGERLRHQGKNELAVLQLEKALALSADQSQDAVELRLAEIYFAQGRDADTEKILKKQLEENPDNRLALLGCIRLAVKRHDFNEARELIERAQKAGVPEQELRLQEALMLAVQDKVAEATKILEEILRKDKSVLSAWEMLVDFQIASHDEKALQRTIYNLEGIDLSRGYLHSYASGHLAMMQGDADGVARYFEQALLYQPTNVRLLQFLIRLDMFQGKPDDSERRTRKLL
ncbi:MAG: DUF2723 domain-containing protein, partial [Verrucomicrobia bacterium]|nr:DUF2723 domain-containing protein [Verrucomicrobiota bacterium]